MENENNKKYQESVIEINDNNLINSSLNESSTSNEKKTSLINSELNNVQINDKNNTNIINIDTKKESEIKKDNILKEYIKKDSIIEFREKEISCKPAKDKEDFFFKKKLLSEEWFKRSNYIDIDLVQDHLSSFKYLWCECQDLEIVCTENLFNHAMSKPNLFESKNVRNIV